MQAASREGDARRRHTSVTGAQYDYIEMIGQWILPALGLIDRRRFGLI